MFKNWFKNRFGAEQQPPRATGLYQQRALEAGRSANKVESRDIDLEPHVQGSIESIGPGKNVFVRSKYVREDTGTHETLKIIDESLLDSEDTDGVDPYNTGRFDLSKNWHSRSRN